MSKRRKKFPQRNSRQALAGMSQRSLHTRRIRALKLLYHKGWGYAQVGRKVGVSRQAVHQWCIALVEGRGTVGWEHLD